jgi:hypothetical protein
MIIRSFSNGFQISDWSEELNVVPNEWGTIGQLGLFQEEPVAADNVTFEEIIQDGSLLVDRVRGDRSSVGKDYTRKVHTFAVPHFPLEDAILPKDLEGSRAYGKASEEEKLAEVRARKMQRIARQHAWTLEAARAQVLTAGTVYAPNGTVSQNWFTEFGVSQTTVDFVLGTAGTNVLGKIESAIAAIQDNTGNGGVITGVVALCSPTFFAKLISHATITTAYQYYASTQDPLRSRLAPNGSASAMHREFFFGGVRFVEMRDQYAGSPLIPVGDAVFIPTGTDAFRTYFAPAGRFGLVNTLGERMYMFETASLNGTKIEIETESNHISACMRPACIIRGFSSN